jgi:GH25 family lysozyme M1 (1,4-beta-N-acetylmuramidase)
MNSKVIKLKNEWRNTRKLIKQANKAHNKKNYKQSIGFSKKALNEAKMALEQYKSQKDNYRFFE